MVILPNALTRIRVIIILQYNPLAHPSGGFARAVRRDVRNRRLSNTPRRLTGDCFSRFPSSPISSRPRPVGGRSPEASSFIYTAVTVSPPPETWLRSRPFQRGWHRNCSETRHITLVKRFTRETRHFVDVSKREFGKRMWGDMFGGQLGTFRLSSFRTGERISHRHLMILIVIL